MILEARNLTVSAALDGESVPVIVICPLRWSGAA